MKDFHRAPFAGENKFWQTIPIEVAPKGAADQANLIERFAVGFIELKPGSIKTIEPRGNRLRVMTGKHAPADKQVQMALPGNISQGERSGAGGVSRQAVVDCLMRQIELLDTAASRQAIFIVS